VSVAVKKVNGVQDVKVSLNEGSADIKLKDGNKVGVEQIRDIIRKNGFTPKDAEVKVAGKVIERNGKWARCRLSARGKRRALERDGGKASRARGPGARDRQQE
jgi:copper chaperone CopZ